MIFMANTLIYPGTMMIHFKNALITNRTMMTSLRLKQLTFFTIVKVSSINFLSQIYKILLITILNFDKKLRKININI